MLQNTQAYYRWHYIACSISFGTLQTVRFEPFWKNISMPTSTILLAEQEILNRYCAVPVLNKKRESKQNQQTAQTCKRQTNIRNRRVKSEDKGREKKSLLALLAILLNDLKAAMSVLPGLCLSTQFTKERNLICEYETVYRGAYMYVYMCVCVCVCVSVCLSV